MRAAENPNLDELQPRVMSSLLFQLRAISQQAAFELILSHFFYSEKMSDLMWRLS